MATRERTLTKVWSSSVIADQIGQWGQIVQLIIHEAKNGDLEGLCMALS